MGRVFEGYGPGIVDLSPRLTNVSPVSPSLTVAGHYLEAIEI